MTDRYLAFANHPWGRSITGALGLPQPRPLPRRDDAFTALELAGRTVQLIGVGAAPLRDALARDITALGGSLNDSGPLQTLVIDAGDCEDLDALHALFRQTQAALPRLGSGARVLVIGPDADASQLGQRPLKAACAAALTGFTRSLAKELGRRGATANLLQVSPGAGASLAGALRFFGTDRSAYVSGQVLGWRVTTERPEAPPRTALVTGTAGGIGAATARRLAREGLRVLCVDVPASRDALEVLARDIGGQSLALDLTDVATPAALADALRDIGGVDVLVHNAGLTRDRTLTRMSAPEWDTVMAVNLAAIAAIDDKLDAQGLVNPGAREICLSSISGIAGNAGQTNYAASKAALIGFVRSRSAVLETLGATINAVAPGFIETSMTRRMPLLVREGGRRLNSLKQGGLPEDVAEAIAWLASPAAQPVSGQVLRVCGQSLLGA